MVILGSIANTVHYLPWVGCYHCMLFILVGWMYVISDEQGFIESVTELVKVKSEVRKLMNKVESTNKVIQDSGREVRTFKLCVRVTTSTQSLLT